MTDRIAPTVERINLLAGLFLGTLARWLTDEQFKEFCRRTREDFHEQTCHSHDYCDANMAMDEAFRTAFGRSPEADSDDEMTLFNAAWDRAKAFTAGRIDGMPPLSGTTAHKGSVNPGFCCAICGAGFDFGCNCKDD